MQKNYKIKTDIEFPKKILVTREYYFIYKMLLLFDDE